MISEAERNFDVLNSNNDFNNTMLNILACLQYLELVPGVHLSCGKVAIPLRSLNTPLLSELDKESSSTKCNYGYHGKRQHNIAESNLCHPWSKCEHEDCGDDVASKCHTDNSVSDNL